MPPQQGKDLDNLALDVLPAVHEVLRPHVEPWHLTPGLLDEGDRADTQMKLKRDQALKRLKSLNAQSVTAYQVVELKRRPEHPVPFGNSVMAREVRFCVMSGVC
ncbi:hypothetical protein ACFP2T_43190 [Plantactinospora solaniradicis]|uniref:Uncharacterized protein n=1 Tax=Plantactinospora solaniradicis TaxID=1723736 RepID=A0ABW1KPQ3_9ACTN